MGCKISASLSYITVRGEGKIEYAGGGGDALSLPLPGWPASRAFVTVNESQQNLATSILLLYALCAEQGAVEIPRSAETHCLHSERLSPLQNVHPSRRIEIEFLQALFCRLSENKRDRRTDVAAD